MASNMGEHVEWNTSTMGNLPPTARAWLRYALGTDSMAWRGSKRQEGLDGGTATGSN